MRTGGGLKIFWGGLAVVPSLSCETSGAALGCWDFYSNPLFLNTNTCSLVRDLRG